MRTLKLAKFTALVGSTKRFSLFSNKTFLPLRRSVNISGLAPVFFSLRPSTQQRGISVYKCAALPRWRFASSPRHATFPLKRPATHRPASRSPLVQRSCLDPSPLNSSHFAEERLRSTQFPASSTWSGPVFTWKPIMGISCDPHLTLTRAEHSTTPEILKIYCPKLTLLQQLLFTAARHFAAYF